MRDLNYALKQLCRRNRDGSFATQANRERILDLIADQLYQMGFRNMDAHSLKPKHVEALAARWLSEELAPGTIKNRMTQLRKRRRSPRARAWWPLVTRPMPSTSRASALSASGSAFMESMGTATSTPRRATRS